MATIASDTFEDTNGTDLETHDSSWSKNSAYGNACQIVASGSGGSGQGRPSTATRTLMYRDETPSSADYSVTADIVIESASGTTGVMARQATTAGTGYLFALTATTGWRVFRMVGGGFTQIGSTTGQSPVSGTFAAVKIDVSGTGATVTVTTTVNGVAKSGSPISDTHAQRIVDANKGGFYFETAATDSTGMQLDNFLWDEVGGAAAIYKHALLLGVGI